MKLRSSEGQVFEAAVTRVVDELGKGKEGAVQKVVIAAEHPRGLEIGTMAEKQFHNEQIEPKARAKKEQKNRAQIDRALELHRTLLAKGYPTIPKMLVDEESNRLYMTDMSFDGRRDVYSTPDLDHRKPEQPITLSNAEGLSLLLGSLLRKSAEDRLYIKKKDVFFMPVDNETMAGEVVFGDLNQMEFVDEGQEAALGLVEHNAEILRKFVKKMNEVLDEDSQLSTEYIDEVLASLKE